MWGSMCSVSHSSEREAVHTHGLESGVVFVRKGGISTEFFLYVQRLNSGPCQCIDTRENAAPERWRVQMLFRAIWALLVLC